MEVPVNEGRNQQILSTDVYNQNKTNIEKKALVRIDNE